MTGPARSVVTIGTFDGVHVGHCALVRRARSLASKLGARVVALVFDPSPLETLRPSTAPARLTTWAQRERLLREAGTDLAVRLHPTPDLLAEPAEAFLRRIVALHGVVGIVEGPDFRFGNARRGDAAMLGRLSGELGYALEIVEPVEVALTDHLIAPARSTTARWLLANGRVRDAACVLGRHYSMVGAVVRGDRRGRTIGYPTANLDSPCMVPADGVYAGRARLADGRVFTAAISVGTKPTFGERARAVEAVLLDGGVQGASERDPAEAAPVPPDLWAPIEGLPEYGWEMELEFVGWVRDQVRFESVGALLEQMGRDCRRVREMVGSAHTPGAAPEHGAVELLQEARA